MHPVLRYGLARFAIFAAMAALLWLLGLDGLLGILLALVLTAPLSYLMLARQQTELTDWVQARRERRARIRAELRGDDE